MEEIGFGSRVSVPEFQQKEFPTEIHDIGVYFATRSIHNHDRQGARDKIAKLARSISKILGFNDSDIVSVKVTIATFTIVYVEDFERTYPADSKGFKLAAIQVGGSRWKASLDTRVSTKPVDIESNGGEVISLLNHFYYGYPVSEQHLTDGLPNNPNNLNYDKLVFHRQGKKHPESWLDDEGCIPAGHICPFRIICPSAPGRNNTCNHLGFSHTKQFSCASARGYDMTKKG